MAFWDITASGLMGLGQVAGQALYGQYTAQQQYDRQRNLMDLQTQNQMRLNQQGADIQKEMWKYTNYGNQIKMMKEAGLNPSLLYGKGGGGGVTGSQGGGSASGGSVGQAPMIDISALNFMKTQAEINLLKAQEKATLASAGKASEETTSLAFDNAIKDKYRNQIEVAKNWEWTSTGAKSEEEWKAWQIRKEILYGGDKQFDPKKPNKYSDQLDREIQTSIETLKQLKTKGDTLEFENEIEKFKATLAKNGISPDSPWYAKLVVDMLEKVGLGKLIRSAITN